MGESPLVSICCLTYNHAPFIRACIDGFLMQQTSFGIEILIHDDCSTDGTDEIIREYAGKYPNTIFPLYEEVNQYSQGYGERMDIEFNYSRARGKYIAYCEGDDYWTDPLKLQKQVDFMEAHPDYSVCFHRCSHLNTHTGEKMPDLLDNLFGEGVDGVDITLDMFFQKWVTQPLTMMFRLSSFSAEWQKKYKHYRDMHEIYHLLKVGKGRLMAFDGGVYRFHRGGIHSMISEDEYYRVSLPIDAEFYRINPSQYSKKVYLDTLQTGINCTITTDRKLALKFLFEYFKVSHNYKRVAKYLWRMIKS